MTNDELLLLQYRLLGHKEGQEYTEFRVLNSKGVIGAVRWVKTEFDFFKEAKLLIENFPDQSIFVGLNPRKSTAKADLNNIASVNVIMLDFDPIRPTGEASTDEQHERTIERGRAVVDSIPNAVLVDSGSGAHVYIPINPIPVDDPKVLTKRLQVYHESLRARFQSPGVKIDATFDLPRVTRLWGSFNPKSKRICKPLSNYENVVRSKIELPNICESPKQELREPYLVRFGQLVNNNPALKNMMAGIGLYPSPSEAQMAFVSILTRAQFDTESIKKLARLNPFLKGTQKTEEQIDKDVERIIEKVSANGIGSVSMLHGSAQYLKGLESRKIGYSTGFKKLDDKLAGLQNARMYVVAARTNEGKTSFACNLAYNLVKEGVSVLYFPTELGYEPLFDKIVSQATEIPLKKFQFGNFSEAERGKIKAVVERIQTFPFVVHEDFALTLDSLATKAKSICPQVILVDYVQAIKYPNGGEPRDISNFVRGLKELNEQLNVPIVLCSQLNRGAIGNELSLAQLKGSGSIEEFADVVMALSTLSKYDNPRPVDLHILKSRYSEVGKIRFNFYTEIGKFEEKQDD